MWRAAEILLTVGELLNSTLNEEVNESIESIVCKFEIDVFQYIKSNYTDQKKVSGQLLTLNIIQPPAIQVLKDLFLEILFKLKKIIE